MCAGKREFTGAVESAVRDACEARSRLARECARDLVRDPSSFDVGKFRKLDPRSVQHFADTYRTLASEIDGQARSHRRAWFPVVAYRAGLITGTVFTVLVALIDAIG